MWGRSVVLVAATLVLSAGLALAEDVAPEDVVIEDYAVPEPLTSTPGDPRTGAQVFVDRGLGNCLACHAVSSLENEQFHGTVGPSLDGVSDRWDETQLRAIVVDAKQLFSEMTVMPGFYTLDVGVNPRADLVGKPILTAQQVEDIVAFLATLKE